MSLGFIGLKARANEYKNKLLDKYDNAKFFPINANIWYEEELTDKAFEFKTKNISMVCSDKIMCEMHKVRHEFAHKLKYNKLADIYGKFDGGSWLNKKSDSLKDYRYQVVIENNIEPYYYTEKIIDCFAAMTVPIYIGATKIEEFFNSDGIIKINPKDIDNIEKILNDKDFFGTLIF